MCTPPIHILRNSLGCSYCQTVAETGYTIPAFRLKLLPHLVVIQSLDPLDDDSCNLRVWDQKRFPV